MFESLFVKFLFSVHFKWRLIAFLLKIASKVFHFVVYFVDLVCYCPYLNFINFKQQNLVSLCN